MLPFLAALLFMLILGKKILVPVSTLVVLAVVLSACYFLITVDTNFVLITLFVASPLLIHFRYSGLTRFAFVISVLLPLLVSYTIYVS